MRERAKSSVRGFGPEELGEGLVVSQSGEACGRRCLGEERVNLNMFSSRCLLNTDVET